MDIQNLVPVDYSNRRVLTTAQVAKVFGTSPNVIKENFRYSKKHFQEDIHYFKVTGEALRTLKFKLDAAQESGEQSGISAFTRDRRRKPLALAMGRKAAMLSFPLFFKHID